MGTILLLLLIMPIAAFSKESRLSNTFPELRAKRYPFVERVAFSVRTSRPVPAASTDRTIRFEQVLLNIGGGYNRHSGAFVVPVTGTYLFMANIRANDGLHGSWAHLMKNHRTIAYLFDNYKGGNTNQVIVRAVKGEHVFLKLIGKWGLFGDYRYPYTSMSGFLLFPG